jgi:hypothetical protein
VETKISELYIEREHMINHLKLDAGNLMDAYSIREDSIRFTEYISAKKKDSYGRETDEYLNEDMNDIKSKWLKYARLIFNDLDFIKFEYQHPYKSDKFSRICEVSVYRNGKFQYGKQFASRLDAETQAYIYEFSNGRIMSPETLAETINNVLKNHLETYNYITGDNAKFTVDNFRLLGAQGESLSYPAGIFLFSALLKDEIVRGSKIDKLLS